MEVDKMTPNIFKSRKFWLTVSDALISIAIAGVTLAFANDVVTKGFILGVIASLQPVFIALINGIATEDAAFMAAEASKEVAQTNLN
jgi:hypothetical protein